MNGGKLAKNKFLYTLILTLIASIHPNIIFRELTGIIPPWLVPLKIVLLFAAGIYFRIKDNMKDLSIYAIILGVIVIKELSISYLDITPFWNSLFAKSTFIGIFGGSILLKVLGTIPLIGKDLFC